VNHTVFEEEAPQGLFLCAAAMRFWGPDCMPIWSSSFPVETSWISQKSLCPPTT